MDLTQPPANPQAPCFWPTGKSQRSHINPAILTSNGHGLMKGGNSALGMWLMDVVILVAFSHADYLPFTFFGPYLVTNTSVKSRSYCRLTGEGGWHPDHLLRLEAHSSPDTALLSLGMRPKSGLSLPLHEGRLFQVQGSLQKLAAFCKSLSWSTAFKVSCLIWCFNYWVQ